MEINACHAVVTGGASGLGLATARGLQAKGADVTLLDLDEDAVRDAAKSLNGRGFACDVRDADGVAQQLALAKEAAGAPGILVNCAGIATPGRIIGREGPLSLGQFEQVIQVNLIGSFNLMRLAAAAMAKNDANTEGERGVIINTASVAAFDGQIGQAAYAASKGGVAALTLPAARELARFGIRVVTIAPGIFETAMLKGLSADVQQSLGKSVPFPPRLGRPAEFADLVVSIIRNPMLNGETIRLDGALRMTPK